MLNRESHLLRFILSLLRSVQERMTSLEKEICQMKTKMENDLHKILELLQAKVRLLIYSVMLVHGSYAAFSCFSETFV